MNTVQMAAIAAISSQFENAKKELGKPTSTVSNFVMALHNAFDKHIPFSLSPEVIMMIISQEVAQYIKDHSSEADIAALVTKTISMDNFRSPSVLCKSGACGTEFYLHPFIERTCTFHMYSYCFSTYIEHV
jgi:hypothetical protein